METNKEKIKKYACEFIQEKIENSKNSAGKIIFSMTLLIEIFQEGIDYSMREIDKQIASELMNLALDNHLKNLEKN